MEQKRSTVESSEGGVALYHVVYAREGFDVAAQMLFELVQKAQKNSPGKPRSLFLDIDGHRNDQGGFDADMMELQKHFLLGFLGKFLKEISCPLISVTNPKPQDNDVPDTLDIQKPKA